MDQLVPSNGRPINVNEYPLSLKPIANDIHRVTALPGWIIVARQPSPDRDTTSYRDNHNEP